MIQIGWRIVKPERHIGVFRCCCQLRHDVFPIRSVCDLVFGEDGVEHAETVMMLCREHHVLLACAASEVDEGLRIEFGGIETLWQSAILRFGNAARLWSHDW